MAFVEADLKDRSTAESDPGNTGLVLNPER
jgi:hypothetical protein